MQERMEVVHVLAIYTCNKNQTACRMAGCSIHRKTVCNTKYHILELNLTLRKNTRESIKSGCAVDGAARIHENFDGKSRKIKNFKFFCKSPSEF